MSYGFDTIKVGFLVPHSEINLNRWKHTSHSVVKETTEDLFAESYQTHFRAENGTDIFLKYVPTDYNGNPFNMLFIEFSLPKLVFGFNYQDLDDWQFAFRSANSVIRTIPGLPPLPDIRDAILHRIDLCANIQVGVEDVSDYIQALHKGHHPHRTTKPFGKNGVMFVAKEISTCIYDKFQECGCAGARGVLRYEISMHTRWVISKWMGKPDVTLRGITKELVHDLLVKDVQTLHLDKDMVCDRQKVQAILKAKYSHNRVQKLLGYLEIRQTMTVEQMKQEGYTSRSIRYHENLLAAASISSLSIESKKSLPPLTLLLEELGGEKNCHKVPSDTRTFEFSFTKKGDSYDKETRSREGQRTLAQGLSPPRLGTIKGKHMSKYLKDVIATGSSTCHPKPNNH